MNCGLPVPGPTEDFTVRPVTSEEVGVWYHVYNALGHPGTIALTFAEGWGNTRFAPVAQADGTPVHTYYVASTTEAVYMESVLHDVASSAPGIFEVDRLRPYHLVTLELPPSIPCVSFHTHDLPRLQEMSRTRIGQSSGVLPGKPAHGLRLRICNGRRRKPSATAQSAMTPDAA